MKLEAIGPIAFIALGIVAGGIGALVETTTGTDPFAFYAGGTISVCLGIYLAIDRKRARNLFSFSS